MVSSTNLFLASSCRNAREVIVMHKCSFVNSYAPYNKHIVPIPTHLFMVHYLAVLLSPVPGYVLYSHIDLGHCNSAD